MPTTWANQQSIICWDKKYINPSIYYHIFLRRHSITLRRRWRHESVKVRAPSRKGHSDELNPKTTSKSIIMPTEVCPNNTAVKDSMKSGMKRIVSSRHLQQGDDDDENRIWDGYVHVAFPHGGEWKMSIAFGFQFISGRQQQQQQHIA